MAKGPDVIEGRFTNSGYMWSKCKMSVKSDSECCELVRKWNDIIGNVYVSRWLKVAKALTSAKIIASDLSLFKTRPL